VTIKGVCKDKQAKGTCQTVITREEMDRYITGSAPEASDQTRGKLAVQYARALALSALAEQQGLDKNPAVAKEIDEQLKLIRMRILASAYMSKLQQQPAVAITPAEVQKYYEEHKDQYERTEVRRVSVPMAVPTEDGRPLEAAAVKAEMEELRSRAVKGEDLEQLQLEAYKHFKIQATPPPVPVITLRHNEAQGDELKVFDLPVGEISPVLNLPAAFVLMKVDAKDAAPIETVRKEIEATLRRERAQSEIAKVTGKIKTQFNLDYLKLRSQPDVFSLTSTVDTVPAPTRTARRTSPVVRR
jgi:hypothetical protein